MTEILLKRSATPSKRPSPSGLADGQPAVNFGGSDPGLYFRDSSGTSLVKIGPCHVGTAAPNSSPPSGGFPGNSEGEFWLDITNPGEEILKVWDGSGWIDFQSVYDFIPSSIIQAKGNLIVGQAAGDPEVLPPSTNGYVLTLDSAQPLGVKWAPTASSASIETITFETITLIPGQTQEFWLDLGTLFSLVSLGVTSSPSDGWIRVYTTEAAMLSDTRVAPGPPFPLPSSGFAAEVVLSGSQPNVILAPVPTFYTESGVFFRFTNQGITTDSFNLSFKALTTVPTNCVLPPYSCNPYVNTSCVTNFDSAWANCSSITLFPALDFNAGLSFNATWQNCTSLVDFPPNVFDSCLATDFEDAWQNCALSQESVDNILVSLDSAGQSNGTVDLDGGTSSAPSSTGLTAEASLVLKGWTVTTN